MREIIDLKESSDGDLIIENGDFADTGINYGEAASQLIRTILNTKPGENALWPFMGFNADTYEGMPNTERTGRMIADVIKMKISENSVFYPFEVDVEPFPIGRNTVAFKIELISIPGNTYKYVVAYDTKENRLRSLNLNEGIQSSTIKVTVPQTKNHRAQ